MNHLNEMNARKRSYEVHSMDQNSHAYPSGMIASPASFQWHEMDYTSSTMDAPRFAPTSAPVQYSAGSMMSFSPVDYSQHDYPYPTGYVEHDGSSAPHQAALYRIGPFRYTELANLDGDTASVSQESIYSRGTRLHSLTDSERRDSQPNSILSSNDIRRESGGYDRMFPVTPMEPEGCRPDACGPEPSCLDLTNLVSIEECASVPCMTSSPHFAVPRPPSNPTRCKEQESPVHATHSGFTSPTALSFQDAVATDTSKTQKPRKIPRSKSAHASIGNDATIEKATKLRARQAHSLVERKYRDNLNLKISQLHQTLQNARFGPVASSRSPQKDLKSEYFDDDTFISPDMPNDKSSTGSTPTGPKVRKSDVLTEAMNYVNSTEVEMRHMSEELMRLNARVKTLEKLIRCEDCSLLKQMVTLQVEGQQQ